MFFRLRHFLSGLRWYVVNRWTFLRGGRANVRPDAPVVCFDLRMNAWHRYLHIFMHFLAIEGYAVRIRHRYGFIASWASHDLFRFASGFRSYRSREAERGARWLFTDRKVDRPHVLLDADYYPLPGEHHDDLRLPMPLVDTFYVFRWHERFHTDPNTPRQRAVFFFGSMDPAAYSRQEPSEVFGCFTRSQLLAILHARLPHRIASPANTNEIALRDGRDIVLVDRKDHYITPERLMGVLARYDFFLAPSGVVMPLCHNLVEAIAAGCIPILQHSHLMVPPMRHGENCLAFRDETELLAILASVPSMEPEQVRAMRINVLTYYQNHLSTKAVIASLERAGPDLHRVRMNGELASTNILRDKLARAGMKSLPLPDVQE